VKLKIIETAGEHDPALVESLWENIIEKEIIKAEERDEINGDLPAVIRHKVIYLSKNYTNTDRYFPLKFLIAYLEKLSLGREWNKTWVAEIFLDVGVPLAELLTSYSTVNVKRHSCWAAMGQPHHLWDVINSILDLYLNDPVRCSSTEKYKRHVITRALDLIAVALMELNSQSLPDATTKQLVSSLEYNQTRFDNLNRR